MRMNDNFNIITGEVKHHVPNLTNNRRFTSLDVLRKMKESSGKKNEDATSFNHRKLGTAQDSKLYQYAYIPKDYNTLKQQSSKNNDHKPQMGSKKQSQPVSLINATKLNYNFINHTIDSSSRPNWQVTKKTAPVSKFTDLGRINAPNYSETYKEQPKFGRKVALCNTVCQMQRSYGTDKYFRKFK